MGRTAAARKQDSALNLRLEAAAWAEADQRLARAWRETIALEADLETARAALQRQVRRDGGAKARTPTSLKRLEAACDRAMLARQDLDQAAGLRGLALIEGDDVYQPVRHALADVTGVRRGATKVRIRTPGVARVRGADVEVLLRADVERIATPAKTRPQSKPMVNRGKKASQQGRAKRRA